jgi:hypothetical protein
MSSRRSTSGLADNSVITEWIDEVLGFTIAFTREEGDRFLNAESQRRLQLEVGECVVLVKKDRLMIYYVPALMAMLRTCRKLINKQTLNVTL